MASWLARDSKTVSLAGTQTESGVTTEKAGAERREGPQPCMERKRTPCTSSSLQASIILPASVLLTVTLDKLASNLYFFISNLFLEIV